MNTESPLEPEILMAYSDNDLDDQELVEQIRASTACKKWVSEHRLLRMLLQNKNNTKVPQAITPAKLKLFVAEELSPQDMVETERVLVTNNGLLDEYMTLRAVHIAEGAAIVSEELDQRVLNLIRANPLTPRKSTTAIADRTRPNILTTMWDACLEFLSPRQLAMAGGFAAALIAAVIGGEKMGLYGGPDFHPLIVASLENPEEILTFRGSSKPKGISTNEKGEITSVVLPINPSLIEELKTFEGDPSQGSAGSLVRILNGLISKEKDKDPGLSQSQIIGFDVSSIDAAQIQPTLWDQIQANSPDLELIMVSLIEQENDGADQKSKASKGEPIKRILYFSKVK